MATTSTITALAPLSITDLDASNDVLPIVDVSDTTQASTGTTKKITPDSIFAKGTVQVALLKGGVQFVQPGGGILSHYDEGSWTPTLTPVVNCSALVCTAADSTRIGRVVVVRVEGTMTFTASATATQFSITLPVAALGHPVGAAVTTSGAVGVITNFVSTTMAIFFPASSAISAGSGTWLATLTYMV